MKKACKSYLRVEIDDIGLKDYSPIWVLKSDVEKLYILQHFPSEVTPYSSLTKEQKTRSQVPLTRDKKPNTKDLKLPQGSNAKIVVVRVTVVVDDEARSSKGPNNYLITVNILLATCKSPWLIAK